MRLPTANEINPFDDLDGRTAEQHFCGKDLEAAESLFRQNSIFFQEDLMFMGPAAFRFYIAALVNYIKSEFSAGNADVLNCFAGIVEYRLGTESKELTAVAPLLVSACTYVIEKYDRFDVACGDYGDLRGRFDKLRLALEQLSNSSAI